MANDAARAIPDKIDSLTSLRFFAAFAIVLGHTKDYFSATAWIPWFPYGYGVTCFFVLSGFILTYVYQEFRSKEDWAAYLVARVARIWPLHIVSLLLFFILVPQTQWFPAEAAGHEIWITVSNVFLVHAWVPVTAYFHSGNPVSSSISDEIFFYLAFAALVYKWPKNWHWKLLLTILLIGTILTIATARGVPNYGLDNQMSVSAVGIGAISPFTRIFDFVLGMVGALVFRWLSSQQLPKRLMLWTALEVAVLFLPHLLRKYVENMPSWLSGHDLTGTAWIWFMATSGAAPAFMVIIVVAGLNRGVLSRLMRVKPLILLGEASYALYLTHLLIFMWITANRAQLVFIPETVQCVLYWVISLATSFLLWMFVERPCRSFIRTRLARRFAPREPVRSGRQLPDPTEGDVREAAWSKAGPGG